jgi:biopolymer transport protein ExbD
MLVLLVIFIVTMPVLSQSIPVELPHASGSAQPEISSVHLSIDAKGLVYWNDQPVSAPLLASRLQELAQNPQARLEIWGDRHAAYEHVLTVMAAAKQAGVSHLDFAVEDKQP